jgi:hypothetical protein
MSKRKARQFRGSKCLNCQTALDISEKYCHQCGQLNSTKKITIADFFEEFLSNFYAYDSRLRNSIISMFTKPGILAKEFNEGKRQKYANPFRLFLSVSIVLFLVMGISKEIISPSKKENNKSTETNTNKKNDSVVHNVLGTKVTVKNGKNDTIVYHKDSIYTKEQISKGRNGFTTKITSFRNFNIKYPEKSVKKSLKELGYENNFINKFIFNKSLTFHSNDINKEISNYIVQKLPILFFLMLPFITLMFWVVFYTKSKTIQCI